LIFISVFTGYLRVLPLTTANKSSSTVIAISPVIRGNVFQRTDTNRERLSPQALQHKNLVG
jgi:hypothetical protein